MSYDTLLINKNEDEYQRIFFELYCQRAIKTFDNISVRFRKSDFDHAFYESSHRNGIKDVFSSERAERVLWIKKVLQDSNAELYEGWNKRKRAYTRKSRVALVVDGYVVIIRITGQDEAQFVTAYVPGKVSTGKQRRSTFDSIRSGPKW